MKQIFKRTKKELESENFQLQLKNSELEKANKAQHEYLQKFQDKIIYQKRTIKMYQDLLELAVLGDLKEKLTKQSFLD